MARQVCYRGTCIFSDMIAYRGVTIKINFPSNLNCDIEIVCEMGTRPWNEMVRYQQFFKGKHVTQGPLCLIVVALLDRLLWDNKEKMRRMIGGNIGNKIMNPVSLHSVRARGQGPSGITLWNCQMYCKYILCLTIAIAALYAINKYSCYNWWRYIRNWQYSVHTVLLDSREIYSSRSISPKDSVPLLLTEVR